MKSKTKALLVIGTVVAAGIVSALIWSPKAEKKIKKWNKKAKKYKGMWAAKTHGLKEKAQHAADEIKNEVS